MTVTVGEAFEALGYALKDDETVCIASNNESWIEQSLHQVANEPVGTNRYFSTGTFPKDTKWGKQQRAIERCKRILCLPFDFDLKDFLNLESKEDVLELSNEEIESYLPLLQSSVEEVFERIGLPIHRLDYTGYGLAAQVHIPPHKPEQVQVIKEIHSGIVRRINHVYGSVIADRQVADAGSRVIRLIPCLNVGQFGNGAQADPRQSRNIYQHDGYVTEAMLRVASDAISWSTRPVHVPEIGDVLSVDDIHDVIEAYKPYHNLGQRHFMSLGIAGQLAKFRIPESQALRIVSDIAAEDRKPWDRQKSVRDTYQKVRAGIQVSGFIRLKGIVSEDVINKVDLILSNARDASRPSIRFTAVPVENGEDRDDKNRPVRFEEYPEPPDQAFYGWFRKYVDLMHPTTEATKGFHLAAALNVVGALVGRRIGTMYASEILYPNQYTLLVGPTGTSRKGTTMKRASRLPQYRSPSSRTITSSPYTVLRDIGSGPALVKTLKDNPSSLVVFEEATSLFSNIQRKGGEALLDRLIEAWDTPEFIQDNVKTSPNVARDFFLTIIAGTQPGRIEDAITANEIDSGLANRMCIFFGVRREIKARAPRLDEAAAAMLFHEISDAIMAKPHGMVLHMSEDAGELWDDWYVSYSSESGTEDELAMRIRHPDMIQKWALLFAIADRADAIERPHLESAMAVLDWMWDGIKRRLPTWGVSVDKRIEELVFQTLKRDGSMKRRDLQRKTSRRKWSGRDFAAVLRAMIENGHILTDSDGYVGLAEVIERSREKIKRSEPAKEAA